MSFGASWSAAIFLNSYESSGPGAAFAPDENETLGSATVVVVSHSLWQRRSVLTQHYRQDHRDE